jgi:peptide deformylase
MYREGCLSFPGRFWWIDRPAVVTMTYYDVKGNKHVREDNALAGRLWQHEVDHLKGRLFIDRLTKSHRKKFERELAGG